MSIYHESLAALSSVVTPRPEQHVLRSSRDDIRPLSVEISTFRPSR